jgi:hypothetical protein
VKPHSSNTFHRLLINLQGCTCITPRSLSALTSLGVSGSQNAFCLYRLLLTVPMPPRTSQRKYDSSASTRAQTVTPRVSQKAKLLPAIKGPKIGPFRRSGFDKSSDFRFEQLLKEPSSSGGGEGYVFKATLKGQTYAVKLVSRRLHSHQPSFFVKLSSLNSSI